MALIPWSPFKDFDRYLERFFEEEFVPVLPKHIFEPAIDVYETDTEVVAEMPLAGVDPEKVEISVEDNMLQVKGSVEEEKEEKKKDYYRKEVKRGAFARSVLLPVPVKGDEARAEYEKGMLKITLPKVTPAPVEKKKIKVVVKE